MADVQNDTQWRGYFVFPNRPQSVKPKVMLGGPPERDWKYLRGVFDEMLEELARRINDEVREILARADISENEKRGRVYDIVWKRDRVVAECFDDWRRSRLYERCWALKKHGLLKPEHLAKLSPESQRAISPFDPA